MFIKIYKYKPMSCLLCTKREWWFYVGGVMVFMREFCLSCVTADKLTANSTLSFSLNNTKEFMLRCSSTDCCQWNTQMKKKKSHHVSVVWISSGKTRRPQRFSRRTQSSSFHFYHQLWTVQRDECVQSTSAPSSRDLFVGPVLPCPVLRDQWSPPL